MSSGSRWWIVSIVRPDPKFLLMCHEQGLLGNELFAIDGCKMPSDASKEWSGTFKELEQKRDKIKRQIQHHLNEHQKLDKYETRDDARVKRAEQAIETLDKANDKLDQFLKCNSPRMGQGKRAKGRFMLLQNRHFPHPCGSGEE